MTLLNGNPDDQNFLTQLNFRFWVRSIPNVNFFVNECSFPGINLPYINQPNPFVDIPHAGDHIHFDDFVATFKVDESMSNYLEIQKWIYALGYPNSFDEYAARANAEKYDREQLRSDVVLHVLNAQRRANIEFVFKDAFPYYLSGFRMSAKDQEIQFVEATAGFRFTSYEVVLSPENS